MGEDRETRIGSRGKWMALLAALLGWMFDGFEMGLFPLLARPALLNLGIEKEEIGTWMGQIMAVFLVGAAAGGVIFGRMGDRIGRVRAMVWSVLVYALFSGACAFARTPMELAILRFIASLGMGGEWSLGVALVMEIWPAASRTLLAGVIGAAANVGYLLIGVVSLLLGSAAEGSGWRNVMLIGAAPAVLTFFIRVFVPESERWKRAASGAPKARVADIFAPGLARLTLLGTCLAAIALLGTWGSVQWLPSWADKLSNKLSGARAWTQISQSAGAVLGTIVAAYMAEWLSRKLAYFLLALASLIACLYLFWMPLWVHLEYGGHFLFCAFVVGGVTASFYGWLPLYLPELFPTRVRATGQGFAFNMGRVLAAAGTLESGRLLNHYGEDYAAMCRVISLVYLLGLVVIWFCPETKGKPLPE